MNSRWFLLVWITCLRFIVPDIDAHTQMRFTYHALNAMDQEKKKKHISVIFSLYNVSWDFASSHRVVDSPSIGREFRCWERTTLLSSIVPDIIAVQN